MPDHDHAATAPPGPRPAVPAPSRPGRPRGLSGTIWVLEHVQDYVAGVVGVALILLAAVLIVSGLIGWPCPE